MAGFIRIIIPRNGIRTTRSVPGNIRDEVPMMRKISSPPHTPQGFFMQGPGDHPMDSLGRDEKIAGQLTCYHLANSHFIAIDFSGQVMCNPAATRCRQD